MATIAPEDLTIGRRVRWARKQVGLSQDRLAAAIGTTRQAIIRWEKDRNLPNERSRERLAEATGQHPDFFAEKRRPVIDKEEDDAMRRLARDTIAPFQRGDGRGAPDRVPVPRRRAKKDAA